MKHQILWMIHYLQVNRSQSRRYGVEFLVRENIREEIKQFEPENVRLL